MNKVFSVHPSIISCNHDISKTVRATDLNAKVKSSTIWIYEIFGKDPSSATLAAYSQERYDHTKNETQEFWTSMTIFCGDLLFWWIFVTISMMLVDENHAVAFDRFL